MPASKPRGVFYGWWLAGVAAFVILIGIVPLFMALPAWVVVLSDEFPSWSAGEVSWAYALTRVEGSLMGPVGGYLIDRQGPRRMLLAGWLVMGVGWLIFSQVHELWQFYLAFLVMSVGVGLGTWHAMMALLNNWFVRRKTTAMSIAIEGVALGGVVMVPLIAWAIGPEAVGWRTVAMTIGIIVLLLAFPISRLIRNRPEEYGLLPDGDTVSAETRDRTPGSTTEERKFSWKDAVRSRTFWYISLGHAASAMAIHAILVHLGLMLQDRDLSLQLVGWVVATYMGVQVIFTIVGGYVGDRVPIGIGIFVFSSIQGLSLIILVFLAHSEATAILFAVILGIGFGGRNPMTSAIWGVYFGRKSYASIVGLAQIPFNAIVLIGPLFAGYMFDALGKYDVPFLALAGVNIVGGFLFLMLGPPSKLGTSRQIPSAELRQS